MASHKQQIHTNNSKTKCAPSWQSRGFISGLSRRLNEWHYRCNTRWFTRRLSRRLTRRLSRRLNRRHHLLNTSWLSRWFIRRLSRWFIRRLSRRLNRRRQRWNIPHSMHTPLPADILLEELGVVDSEKRKGFSDHLPVCPY
jgi:hypothetical protein